VGVVADNANVRIVIDAITEAAEQALNQVGDEISGMGRDARVGQAALNEVGDELNNASVDAGIFKKAVDRAKAGTRGLAVSLGILQGRADEAGDEIAGAGGKAVATGGLFSALTVSTSGLSLSMGSLSTSINAALIPALVALSTTLVPLAATIGTVAAAVTGLAGAFGAVIGSGILAYGDKLSKQNKERLREVNQEIKQLEELRRKRGELTDEEQERVKQARATVKQLQEQARAEDGLSSEQRARLASAQETIASLHQQKQQSGALTKQEKERLKTLKDKRKELQDQTSVTGALGAKMADLKAELMPLVVEFGQKFIPLIEDAVDALPTLVRDTLEAVGGLGEFKSALRDFGSGAMDAIPEIASTLVDLGREALPVVRDLIGFLMDDGGDAFSEMVATTKDLGPQFSEFAGALVDAAPAVNDFGTNVLKRLLPALSDLVRGAGRLMADVDWELVDTYLGMLGEVARDVAPYLAQLGTEVAEAGRNFVPIARDILPTLTRALQTVVWAIGVTVEAWNDLSPRHRQGAFIALATVIGTLGGPLLAVAAAIAIVGVAFDDLQAAAKGALDWLDSKLDSAADWVGAFVSDAQTFLANLPEYFVVAMSNAVGIVTAEGNKIYNFFAGLWNDLLSQATTGLEGLTNKFVSGLNKLISKMNGLIRTANKKVPGFQMGELGTLGRVQMDSSSLEMERRSTNANTIARRSARDLSGTLELDVRGEGPLAEFVDQRAEAKVQRGNRRDTRRLRRQNVTQ